jgi:hypothetical protein
MPHKPMNVDRGLVVCGWRHGNCIATMSSLGKLRSVTFGPDSVGENEQGFLTTKGNFVNREIAYEMAERNGQIIGRDSGEPHCKGTLYSEDLY